MPVDPIILATTDTSVGDETINKLNEDLIDQMGADAFNAAAGEFIAVSRSTSLKYYDKPNNLPEFETTIVCHPASPFYGPNYARGYWPDLAALLEILRKRIPDSTIWYGPDSSDIVEEVTADWMRRMWDYWAENGSREYYRKK